VWWVWRSEIKEERRPTADSGDIRGARSAAPARTPQPRTALTSGPCSLACCGALLRECPPDRLGRSSSFISLRRTPQHTGSVVGFKTRQKWLARRMTQAPNCHRDGVVGLAQRNKGGKAAYGRLGGHSRSQTRRTSPYATATDSSHIRALLVGLLRNQIRRASPTQNAKPMPQGSEPGRRPAIIAG
jgi:hypothetical protein